MTKKTVNLDNLPAEIILQIAQNLQPRGTACLSVTCKSLYYDYKELRGLWIHGFDLTQNHCGCKQQACPPCPPLKMVNHERYLFLQLLARDLANQYQLCDLCVKFHPHGGPTNQRQQPTRTSCTSWQRVLSLWGERDFNLYFEEVQRAMNLYRSGESPELSLRSIFVSRDWVVERRTYSWSGPQNITHITKLDVEPRIISGNLIIHTRQHVLLNDEIMTSLDDSEPGVTYGSYVAGLVSACSHWGCLLQIIGGVDDSMTKIEASCPEEPVGYKFIGTVGCSCCLTEMMLATYYHPAQGHEIVLSTWINLGPCEWGWQVNWEIECLDGLHRYRNTSLRGGAPRAKTTLGYPSKYDGHWVGGQDCSRWILGSAVPDEQELATTVKPEVKYLAWIAMLLAWFWSLIIETGRSLTPRTTSKASSQYTPRMNHMALKYFQHDRPPISPEKLDPPVPVRTRPAQTSIIHNASKLTALSSPSTAVDDRNNSTSDAPPPYVSLSHNIVSTTPVPANVQRVRWTSKIRESCRALKKKGQSLVRRSKQKKVKGADKEL